MVLYVCDRCGYSSKRLSNFKYHIFKKRICKPLKTNMSIEDVRLQLNHDSVTPQRNPLRNPCNPQRNPSRNPKVTPDVTPEVNPVVNSIIYKCTYCDKRFRKRQHRYRHEKYNCKLKSISDKHNITNINTTNNIDNSNINNSVNTDNRIQNNINNIDNIDNSTQNIEIHLNYFGNETNDDEILTHDFLLNILKNPETCFRKIINQLHMNKEHPENGNMRITNKKLRYAEYYTKDGWMVEDKTTLCFNLVNKGNIKIDKFVEQNRKDIPEDIIREFNRYSGEPRFNAYEDDAKKIEIDLLNWTRYMKSIQHMIPDY